MEDISERIARKLLYGPINATATATSSACDVSGYEGAAFCVAYGISADTLTGSLYWTAKLQSCATENGSYADVATADIQIAATNSFGLIDDMAEDNAMYWIGYNGTNQWVKVVVTATGSHTLGTPITIIALLGMPRSVSEEGAVNP